MAKALTDLGIKHIKPGAAGREVPIGGARGLYLVVQKTGAKSFVVRYRLKGKPQKLTLGRWVSPADLKPSPDPRIGDPLASARKLAADTMLQVGRGIDPAADKETAGEALTVSGMLDQFVERYCKKEKKLRSVDQIESAFEPAGQTRHRQLQRL